MASSPEVAFERKIIILPLDRILPVRVFKPVERNFLRFGRIVDSIKAVGLIEPLSVHPQKCSKGLYDLLDGHLRYQALKDLKEEEASCIVSLDDEAYTYNHWVNRLAPVQEHAMIMKAIKNGVTPERIAATLKVDVGAVRNKMNLLVGIHSEVVELLKDRVMSPSVFPALRKVSSVRQIEMAELMVSAGNFTSAYVNALLIGTPQEHLVDPGSAKKPKSISPEEIARMEEELEGLKKDIKAVEQSYGEDVLTLTLARGYLRSLLENARVTRYISTHHPDFLLEFRRVVTSESI